MKKPILLLAVVLVAVGCTSSAENSTAPAVAQADQSSAGASPATDQTASGGATERSAASLVVSVSDGADTTTTTITRPSTSAVTTTTEVGDTSTSTEAPQTSTPSDPTTTTDSTTTTVATTDPTTTTTTIANDGSNPIVVPVSYLGNVRSSGATRCIEVDLHTIPVPANPGYVGETLGSQHITGDQLWEITWYLMLYANCERQARGLDPFSMFSTDKQLAMQQTVLGINTSHGGFGERADIAGGLAAEGHGGGPRPGERFISGVLIEDDDGNGVWSEPEIARRSASGNQQNGGAGLVDHGDAMTSAKYTCIFAAASLGASEDHRVDIIIFYGNRC